VLFQAASAGRPAVCREALHAAYQAVSEARGSMVHERRERFLRSVLFATNHNMS
jgi:hypothetical protein